MRNLWKIANSPIVLIVTAFVLMYLCANAFFSKRYITIDVDPDIETSVRELDVIERVRKQITVSNVTNAPNSSFGGGSYAKIVGTISNNSKEIVESLNFVISIHDKSGRLVDVEEESFWDHAMYPGTSRDFTITTGLKLEHFKLLDVQISVVDLRIVRKNRNIPPR